MLSNNDWLESTFFFFIPKRPTLTPVKRKPMQIYLKKDAFLRQLFPGCRREIGRVTLA